MVHRTLSRFPSCPQESCQGVDFSAESRLTERRNMKKSVKLGALAATASLLAACASSGGGQGPTITADPKNSGYVMSQDTGVVMSGFGNCVRQGFFTPAQAQKGCDD